MDYTEGCVAGDQSFEEVENGFNNAGLLITTGSYSFHSACSPF
jgi:hypothetical protein